MGTETATAWRLLKLNWILVAVLALVLAVALAATDFWLKIQSATMPLAIAAVYGGMAYRNLATPRLRDTRIVFTLASTAQLVLIVALLTPLTYVAAAADLPLQDGHLVMLDRALGLDWPGYVAFFNARPWLFHYLSLGYRMIAWPILGLPVILGMTGNYVRLQKFTLAFTVALIVTTVVSMLVPAEGAFYGHHLAADAFSNIIPGGYLDQIRDFPAVRDGVLRALDILHLVGIITFPSFHAVSAVLFVWALWPVWWMRPFALISNALMLAGTPIGGGHYFVDVFAGIAVGVLAIAAADAIGARLARPVRVPAFLTFRMTPRAVSLK